MVLKVKLIDEMELRKKNPNVLFKKLVGTTIKKFSFKDNHSGDMKFNIVTNKLKMTFGANDLGVWVTSIKEVNK